MRLPDDYDTLRFCGKLIIALKSEDDGTYSGELVVPTQPKTQYWPFSDLRIPPFWAQRLSPDSAKAFDIAAEAVIGFVPEDTTLGDAVYALGEFNTGGEPVVRRMGSIPNPARRRRAAAR
jgi:hypothetical protein